MVVLLWRGEYLSRNGTCIWISEQFDAIVLQMEHQFSFLYLRSPFLFWIFCFYFYFVFVASRSWEHTYRAMESLGHIFSGAKTIWACYVLNFFFHWWGCQAWVPCSRCHWAGDIYIFEVILSFSCDCLWLEDMFHASYCCVPYRFQFPFLLGWGRSWAIESSKSQQDEGAGTEETKWAWRNLQRGSYVFGYWCSKRNTCQPHRFWSWSLSKFYFCQITLAPFNSKTNIAPLILNFKF